MDIAVIGSNNVDLITYIDRMPKKGETMEAPNFAMGCGGKGANQAVSAAKLGAQVMMVTKVGDDMFADNTIANFQKHGIDTTFTKKVPDTTSGVAPIFVDAHSENRILIIKGANNHLKPQDIDEAADKLKQCKLIVLQLEVPLAAVYHAIEFGHQHKIPVIFNPAPATKALDFYYVSQCDFLIPNETELELISGMPVGTEEEVRQAAQFLLDKGVKNVIITLGRRGVLWVTNNTVQRFNAYTVQAVDTTGAGDAFIGCFAQSLVQTGDIAQAIQRAQGFAALSVTKNGTQISYPTEGELIAFLAERKCSE
ncbi:ribokinase [Lentibacillus sp. N15]|uniref:ribokinase n=1 Tax=Lentibacillus songyuanensis TaxID=3136161 RepID=UPI0031BB8244